MSPYLELEVEVLMSKVMLVMAPSFGHKSVLVEVLRVISLLPLDKISLKICFSASTLEARGGGAGVKGGAVVGLLHCVCAGGGVALGVTSTMGTLLGIML